MQAQDNYERAEVIGTPQGLRSLFPTNLVALRMRRINPAEIQLRKIIMNQKTKRDEQDRSAPTGTAQATDRLQREGEGTRGVPEGARAIPLGTESQEPNGDAQDQSHGGQVFDPNANPSGDAAGRAGGPVGSPTPSILPQARTAPGPSEQEGQQQDPGPAPTMPTYSGPSSGAVDQLLMAATARDTDALRAIPTRNEPPQVGQYKANLLQWLDDTDNHKRSTDAWRNAQQRTNPDDEAQQS